MKLEVNKEELKKIWSGEDADVFFNRIDIYLNKVELLKETSKTIGSFMLEADKNYCKADEEFVDDLKRERDT